MAESSSWSCDDRLSLRLVNSARVHTKEHSNATSHSKHPGEPAVSAVVIGNPKPESRTLDAALRVHKALTGTDATTVIDLATFGPGLLGWGDPQVADAVTQVKAADIVVVASPTFKATYSGLLKLFLDQFTTGEGMRDVVAIPLMLGAGPAHALAPDLLLKPVLVELGATTPAPGLYLRDSTYMDDGALEAYTERWGDTIARMRRTEVAR
jgi:FMN reductase